MSNSLDIRVVADGARNAVVKLVGVADTSDINQVSAIPLSLFKGNDPDKTISLAALRVVDIDFAGTPGLLVGLAWNGATPQPIAQLSTSMQFEGRRDGGVSPDQLASGYDGSINVATQGFTPGFVYGFTILLRMTKKYRS